MSIGYACKTIGVPNTDIKSCMQKNATEKRLGELIAINLLSLANMVFYNTQNSIFLFRISSDLIPFGSSPVNKLEWWDLFAPQLKLIGEKIKNAGIRVSMHPGQYSVLNSQNAEVVERTMEDLNYHNRLLDSLGVGSEHKIVLHIGGVYKDKKQSGKRFITNYKYLDSPIKERLVIENDDRSYHIGDVLEIGSNLGIPVIFDILHDQLNTCDVKKSAFYWIRECKNSWKGKDGSQKIHYSQQDPLKKSGSHSETVKINEFMDFYHRLENKNIDIMLEVKDKNLSAVKCINCTTENRSIEKLELEWSRYKQMVLKRSPQSYKAIQQLLIEHKNGYPAIEFYNLLENALEKEKGIK
jgi:UV DNA damage endonuclease